MISLRRKISITIVLVVYLLSFLLSDLMFYKSDFVKAEETISNENIVAVFVDSNLDKDLSSDIEWYATQYIQQKLNDTKAIVFPINKNNFKANDISKMLENLYLEGEKTKSSRLVGTVLVGDIPLPVVNNDGYVFPSIYPYVDFVDKKFVYSNDTGFFEYQSSNNSGAPEIWHGLINFGEDKEAYKNFFKKLGNYSNNPGDFVSDSFWYDDFINLKKYFNVEYLPYYINNFLFFEDLSYHRYSNLLYDMLDKSYKKALYDKAIGFDEVRKNLKAENDRELANADSEFSEMKKVTEQYFQQAESFQNSFMNSPYITNTTDESKSLAQKMPTLALGQVIDAFVKSYNNVFGQKYLNDMVNKLAASGRREDDLLDNHIQKTILKDELAKKIIKEYNDQLMSGLNEVINKEKYDLDVIVPVQLKQWEVKECLTKSSPGGEGGGGGDGDGDGGDGGEAYIPNKDKFSGLDFSRNIRLLADNDGGGGNSDGSSNGGESKPQPKCHLSFSGFYENYYFGKNSEQIVSSDQFSIYRGTHKNIDSMRGLSGYSIKDNLVDDISILPELRSVGVSYGIFDRQISANRGINSDNAKKDADLYVATRCADDEKPEQWAYRYFGGASPMNIDTSNMKVGIKLKSFDPTATWNPSYNSGIGGSVYDIAGSQLSSEDGVYTQSYKGYEKYSNIVKIKDGEFDKEQCKTTIKEISYCQAASKQHKPIKDIEYLNKFKNNEFEPETLGANLFLVKFKDCDGEVGKTMQDLDNDEGGEANCNDEGCTFNRAVYKFVGSKYINDAPTPDQVSGMNMTTPERPIDSTRFITFQGIGGDVIKFVYPDMFNVEVYKKENNKVQLKSIDEIKTSVKDYLRKKVTKYNDSLKENEDKKVKFYEEYKGALNGLKSINKSYDLQIRTYNKISDDYFEKILGDNNIERIASNLYYINSAWLDKSKTSDILAQDIESSITGFNINTKIKFVMDQYLQIGSKSDQLINPYYNSKGYEAGFMNSNGFDILTTTIVPSLISQIQKYKSADTSTTDANSLSTIMSMINSKKEKKECGVSDDGSVSIFEWPGALSCWISQTMSTPMGIKIDNSCAECSKSNNLWGKLFPDSQKTATNIPENGNIYGLYDAQNAPNFSLSNVSDTSNVSNSYIPDRRIKYSQFSSQYGKSNWDTYINNWYNYAGNDETKNEQTYNGLSDSDKKIYDELAQNINIKLSPSQAISLADTDTKYYIDILSYKDLGSLNISFAGLGNNCLIVGSKNLCNEDYNVKVNPYNNETLIPFDIKEKVSGTFLLQTKTCKADSDICFYKNYTVDILPTELNKLEIITPTDKVLRGGKLPLAVRGYDELGNNLGSILQDYSISVDYGTLVKNSASSKQDTFNRFSDAYYIYDTAGMPKTDGNFQAKISLVPSGEFTGYGSIISSGVSLPSVTKNIKIVEGSAQLLSEGSQVGSIQYQLPETLDYIYPDASSDSKVNQNALLKFTLKLTADDGSPLSSIAYITTQNGFMIPGVLEDGNFAQQTEFVLSGGKLDFYLHPGFTAGKDSLDIKIPGINDILVPIEVLPSSPVKFSLDIPNPSMYIGSDMDIKGYVKDYWGNVVYNKNINIVVGTQGKINITDGDQTSEKKTLTSKDGTVSFKIHGIDPGGIGYIYGYMDGTDLSKQSPDYAKITVKNILWPKDKLNIMYLSLFGSDWGNLWGYFSSNKNVVSDIIKNSDKTLAVTTQLIDPNAVKKATYIVSSDLKVNNMGGLETSLGFAGNQLVMSVQNGSADFTLQLGDVNNFGIDKSDNYPEYIGDNHIYYIPGSTDANITSNLFEDKKIKLNNEDVINFNNGYISNDIKITLSTNFAKGYNIWDIMYKGQKAGELLIHRSDENLLSSYPNNLKSPGDVRSSIIFAQGSTNGIRGIAILDDTTNASSLEDSYSSVQDSSDDSGEIGFTADFKNITAFGNGENVGEATKHFSSEYLINFGDPIISRVDKNKNKDNTPYDGGIGKTIYSDSSKTILKSIDIDFNNDGYKDLIVGYRSGEVRLLKNYGGKQPFVDMGDVLYVGDGVSDIFAGDADGNGFPDIIVRTNDDKLRVYKNRNGVFDSDGWPICLDISGGDQNIKSASQIFVEDMDKDGKVDIIVNDTSGNVKVFYGGDDNYISRDKYKCDLDRKSRNKSNLVHSFGLQINSEQKVYDKSLLHREGMPKPQTETTDVNYDYFNQGKKLDLQSSSSIQPKKIVGMNINSSRNKVASAKNILLSQGDGGGEGGGGGDGDGDGGDGGDGSDGSGDGSDGSSDGSSAGDAGGMGGEGEGEGDGDEGGGNGGDGTNFMTNIGRPLNQNSLNFYNGIIETGAKDSNNYNTNLTPNDYQNFLNYNSQNMAKFQELPQEYMPVYESSSIVSDVYYAQSLYMDTSDPISVYKKFTDMNGGTLDKGDIVNVELSFISNQSKKFTYIEQLNGPYIIQRNSDNNIVGFQSDFAGANMFWDAGDGYQFIMDNAEISAGQTLKISYPVIYNGGNVVKIDIDNINDDTYPDIKAYPIDGCYKGYWSALAIDDAKDYKKGFVDLKKKYDENMNSRIDSSYSYLKHVNNISNDVRSSGNISKVKNDFFSEDFSKNDGLVDFNPSMGSDGQITLDVDIGSKMTGMKNLVSKIQNALCNGIKFDMGGCGLPIPINMAFLAPGMFNIMGCPLTPDFGLPIFYFPSTLYTPIPVPVPNMHKMDAMDWFYGIPGGIFPSQIRIYLAPTLTASLGVVICFGPYMSGMLAFPAPFGTIMGNCVVSAVDIPLPTCENKKSKNTDYDYSINDWQDDTYKIGVCQNDSFSNGRYTTPFKVLINGSGQGQEDGFSLPSISVIGESFSIGGSPINMQTTSLNPLSTSRGEKIDVKSEIINGANGGIKFANPLDLKISGGDVRGLIKCIIKKWLDNQIRYIINNLTTMTIYLYLPDVVGLVKGFQNLDMKNISEKFKNFQNYFKGLKDSISNIFSSDSKSSSSSDENKSKWDKVSDFIKKYTPSKATIKKMSDTFTNPFELIASFFEDIPLVNIQNRDVVINVPFIYSDDLERYVQYLKSRKEQFVQAVDDLKAMGDKENGSCLKISDNAQRQDCLNRVSKYVNINIDSSKLLNSIQKNIDRLYEYKHFPLKLYDFIHILDRFLTEVSCTLEKFIDSTIGWLKKNADRFEAWVDLIILLIAIIDTWQILIDFTVNWKLTCGKCRVDNYDFYSCILSLLCIELPVLPIPPFKLPDIYLDFSHIDIGVDIILPNVKFRPVSINLPKLPDLSAGINVDVGLPEIPILPELPSLPEIPSFLPTIEIKLPTLPPAPKIPKILAAIEVILRLAEWIGMILCIIKGNIGLVAERNAKSRVEQITQRKNRVFPFDFLNITIPKPPMFGMDIRVDAYLRLRYEFDQFYNMLDSVAQKINAATNSITKGISFQSLNNLKFNKSINIDIPGFDDKNIQAPSVNKNINIFPELPGQINIDLDKGLNLENRGKIDTNNLFNYNNKKSGNTGYDYKDALQIIRYGLMYFAEVETNPDRIAKAKNVLGMLDTKTKVSPNISGLLQIKKDIKQYFDKRIEENKKLQDKIKNDYDGFLKDISKADLVADTGANDINYKISLFGADKSIKNTIKNQEHPYKTYIDLNKKMIDGFQNSLQENSLDKLNMTEDTYKNAKNYLSSISTKMDKVSPYFDADETFTGVSNQKYDFTSTMIGYLYTGKTVNKDISNSKQMTQDIGKFATVQAESFKKNMIAENTSSADTQKQASDAYKSLSGYVDMSQYTKGFFVKGDDSYYHNVVNMLDKGTKAYLDKEYKKLDINGDTKEDIVWWDKNNVYVKYADQNDSHKNEEHVLYKDYYKTKVLDNPSDLSSQVDKDGYYKISGRRYKVWSFGDNIQGFKNTGQTADNISFSWQKSSEADGYMLKLIQRVDVFYDKDKQKDYYSKDILDQKYVMVVSKDFDEGSNKLTIGDDIDRDFVYDLKKEGKIFDVIHTDISSDNINVTINNLIRKWYYVQVVPLKRNIKDDKLYEQYGTWSIQRIGGVQIWADDQNPQANIKLIRQKTGQIVGEGANLKGVINTDYEIKADWTDNVIVVESWIQKDGEVLKTSKGGSITLDDLYFKDKTDQTYEFMAKDHVGNVGKMTINLNVGLPDLSVKDVDMNGQDGSKVMAQISNEMDDGSIRFERYRNGYWEILTGDDGQSNFVISPNSVDVTGGIFRSSNNIVLKDENNNEIGNIDGYTAKINILPEYQSNTKISLDFSKKVPIINILKDDRNLFDIFLRASELYTGDAISISNGDYQIIKLDNGVGSFGGGTCIKNKENRCVFYISKDNSFYIPEPYNTDLSGRYTYDDSGYVVYQIYDMSGNKIFTMKFIPKPLLK